MHNNRNLQHIALTLGLVFAFTLSACTAGATPSPTVDINAIYTQAAATISVGLTQTEQAKPTNTPIPPTFTPAPSATLEPLPTTNGTETPTTAPVFATQSYATALATTDPNAAHGCYNATFLADVTVLNGTMLTQGKTFTKTWRVKNTGTCDWNRGFLIVFVSGDAMGASNTTINVKVPAGGVAEISLNMTAPNVSGSAAGYWQLATELGKPFGSLLGVSISLPAIANPTSGGCYSSALISQSVADGTEFSAGDKFTQTWTVKNTGTCDWNGNFKITYIGGDVFGSDTTKIRQTVGPGSTAQISLEMTAPSSSGQITSSWQLATDSGTLFGQIFGVVIVVK